MPEMHLEALFTGISGSALTAFLFRYLLHRALNDLDAAIKKINDISTDLARISTRLEIMEKVVLLEARVLGRPPSPSERE